MVRKENVVIPFCVRLTDGSYKGEVIGRPLPENNSYVVRLNNGETFLVEAETDYEVFRYNWKCIKEQFSRLVPIIGRIIERHFAKQKAKA